MYGLETIRRMNAEPHLRTRTTPAYEQAVIDFTLRNGTRFRGLLGVEELRQLRERVNRALADLGVQ